MIRLDEDALICDLAETYHVLDYRTLPARKTAILSVGLPAGARIKKKMLDIDYTYEQALMTAIFDRVQLIYWAHTKSGQKGQNRPKSLLERLTDRKESKVVGFTTGEDFRREWGRITNANTGKCIRSNNTIC